MAYTFRTPVQILESSLSLYSLVSRSSFEVTDSIVPVPCVPWTVGSRVPNCSPLIAAKVGFGFACMGQCIIPRSL